MQFPNTSIDFDKHCEYMIKESEKAKGRITILITAIIILAIVLLICDIRLWWIAVLVALLTASLRFIINKYSNWYFNSRQAQTFRYEFNDIRRELDMKVAKVKKDMPQSIALNDMVTLKRNPGEALLKILNLQYDTNTRDYFLQLAEIEAKLNHSFAKHINEIPRSIRNLSFSRLMKTLKIDKESQLSRVYPIYTFECLNDNDIVIDKVDIVLNVELIRKIVDKIDSKIDMSYNEKRGIGLD